MKKTITLFLTVIFAAAAVAQSSLTPRHTYHVMPGTPTKSEIKHRIQSGARGANPSACDTGYVIDYSTYNEIFAASVGLNFSGSWNVATPEVLADEITAFVDSFHNFNDRYIMTAFDSIVLADYANNSYSYYPRASSTIYLDSLGMFVGIWGDSLKMLNDSLVFSVFTITGNTIGATPVKQVVFKGYGELNANGFITQENYLGYNQIGIGYQFNQGEGFAIQMDYLGKDSSSHCIFSYTYADSCGTIVYQGNTYTSPAYPSPFYGNNFWGEIRTTAGVTSVNDINSAYYYVLTGVAQNCTFVYQQNWEFLPILNVCVNYGATITADKTKSCPNGIVNLNGTVFGTNSTNINYTWSVAGNGTLTSNSGQTTSVVMGASGSVTVTLTVDDGSNQTTTSIVISNNGIGISITNPNPYSIPCTGGTNTIITTTTGNGQGKNYTWSTGASGANAATQSVTQAGTYSVTVTNNSSCSASASVSVIYAGGVTNTASFTPPSPPVCAGQCETFTNTSLSQGSGWTTSVDMLGNGSDIQFPTTATFCYTYASQGVYTVVLTMDSAGCKFNSPPVTITVLSATNALCLSGVEDVTFSNNVDLLPNPTNGTVRLTVSEVEKNISVKVYNIIGSEMLNYNASDLGTTFNRSFDFSNFSNGTYLVKIQSGDKIAVKRLTVAK